MSELSSKNNEQDEAETLEPLRDLTRADLEEYRLHILEKYNFAEQTLNAIAKEQDRRERQVLRGWND